MSQPTPYLRQFNFEGELASVFGTHLDAEFDEVKQTLDQTLSNLARIQRDDGMVRNGAVTPQALSSEALTLIAGSATNPAGVEWKPRGTWITGTLYKVGNIAENVLLQYVCVVEHVASALFVTDLVAGKWMPMTFIPNIIASDITSALGYTPVNRAGDTMTGALVLANNSKMLGAAGVTWKDTYLTTQDLAYIDKGLYSVYSSAKADIVYGFASNVVRTAGAFFTVGAQFSAFGAGAGAGDTAFGANINTFGLNGFASPQVGLEIDVCGYTPNNVSMKFGLDLVFSSRSTAGGPAGSYSHVFPMGTFASVGGGLGSNFYNKNSRAINISAGGRSSTGEYAGWNTGIFFNGNSLDSETDAAYPGSRKYPIGIDFSNISYLGGADPVQAYNLEAAIALRDLQGIWWNRDPASAATTTSKIRTYFNPFTLRWVLMNGATERFGVDVTTGAIYVNGVVFSGAGTVTLGGNNPWTGPNSFAGGVTLTSNLTFTGTGRRIIGNFSDGTIANRVLVQTNVANDATEFGVFPNGTATASGLYGLSSSTLNNCVVGRLGIDDTGVLLSASVLGAHAAVPLIFNTTGGGAQLSATGAFLINTVLAPITGAKFRLNGIMQLDNSCAVRATGSGGLQAIADSTFTKITLGTETYDQDGVFAGGTYTPKAGNYRIGGSTGIVNGGAIDQRRMAVILYKNGVAHATLGQITCSGTGAVTQSGFTEVLANGTDFFELYAWHNMGGAANFDQAATETWFVASRIG